MPAPDIPDAWINAATIIGTLGAVAVAAFAKNYWVERAAERTRSDDSPQIVGKAVGAAIVDKSAADAFAMVAEDVHQIREIAERREKREHDQDVIERAVEKARQQRSGGKPSP